MTPREPVDYPYRLPRPDVPRYSLGQTVVITLAGLAVGTFCAWLLVSATCRLLEWAWS